MHLQADAMTERELKALGGVLSGRGALGAVAGRLEPVTGGVVELAAADPRAYGGQRVLERGPHELLLLGDQLGGPVRRLSDQERARHVGPAGTRLVTRPQVHLDRETGRERAASRLVPET